MKFVFFIIALYKTFNNAWIPFRGIYDAIKIQNAWLYIHTWCCYSHLNFTLGILFSVEIWNPYGFECIQYCVQFQRLCPESPINDALTIINYDNMAYNIHFTHTPVLIFCFRKPKWTDLFSVCFFFHFVPIRKQSNRPFWNSLETYIFIPWLVMYTHHTNGRRERKCGRHK